MMDNKHLTKKWNCLTDLVKYFQTSGVETVKEFNGYSITTNKGYYTLSDDVLRFQEQK